MALRINFHLREKKAKKSTSKSSYAGFSALLTDDSNDFYRFSSDSLPSTDQTLYNGRAVSMPIPPNFMTIDNKVVNDSDGPKILPLLIDIEKGVDPKKEEPHFCDVVHPLERGTACSQFMQKTAVTYFKVDNATTPFPPIRNCKPYEKIVKKYNKKYKGEMVYFLPVITPSNVVIYIVSNNESYIKGLIKTYEENAESAYIIPINGVIVFIDQWDSFFFFGGVAMTVVEPSNLLVSKA